MELKVEEFVMNIEMDYAGIINRFNDNHNKKKYFENDDLAYWELINKAVVVAGRMAKHFRDTTPAHNKHDNLAVRGGGGGNDVYHLFVNHYYEWWTRTIGSVYINFKTREITVEHKDIPESKVRYKYYGIPYKKFIDLKELNELKAFQVEREK